MRSTSAASTSTEALARHLSGSRVVKAFNTMYYVTLASEGRTDAPLEDRLVLFVAGDDGEAKSIVSGLIEDIEPKAREMLAGG